MKNWLTATVLVCAVSAFALEPYEQWTFDNDATNKSFNTFANSGSLNSLWNFGTVAAMKTDGAGNFVIQNHTGQTYRKVPGKGTVNADATLDQYAVPFTSGKYRLEMDYSSWDLSSAAVGSELSFQAVSTNNGTVLAKIQLTVLDASTARIQLSGDFTSGSASQDFDYGLSSTTGAAVAIEFDFDNDTADYYVNGVKTNSFTDFQAAQLGQIVFFTESWAAESVVKINQMALQGPDILVAVDVDDSMVLSPAYKGDPTVTLDTSAPAIGTNDFSGQPFYTGLEEVDINGDPTNKAAAVTIQNNGFKLQWNSPQPSTGAYAAGDVATAAFVFMKEDFLNGLNEGQIVMSEASDTLTAEVLFDPGAPKRLSEANFRWLIKDAGQYYVSAPYTYTVSGSEVITAEALDVTWYEYYPETVSVSAISNTASPALQNIEAIGWQTDATVATNTGARYYAKLAVTAFSAGAGKSANSPTSLWVDWTGGYALGANSNLLDHADSDDLDNLTEYAWGGDPTDGNSQGNAPHQSKVNLGGTNYMEYIYFERDDAAVRGLSSILEVGTDLVFTNWVDGSVYETGNGVSGVAGFNAVTNRVPIDTEAKKFIRLQIEFTP